jgi:hypothetical protein
MQAAEVMTREPVCVPSDAYVHELIDNALRGCRDPADHQILTLAPGRERSTLIFTLSGCR